MSQPERACRTVRFGTGPSGGPLKWTFGRIFWGLFVWLKVEQLTLPNDDLHFLVEIWFLLHRIILSLHWRDFIIFMIYRASTHLLPPQASSWCLEHQNTISSSTCSCLPKSWGGLILPLIFILQVLRELLYLMLKLLDVRCIVSLNKIFSLQEWTLYI